MITDNLKTFIDSVLTNLKTIGVDVLDLELDHFGYQTSSKEDYESKKTAAQQIGKMESENIVNGRRVGIFRLNEPCLYKGFKISGFELVETRDGQVCESALEHLEFVLKGTFQDFMDKYPSVNWDTAALNRPEFAKLSLRFEDGSGVKFHLKNIFEEIPQK